MFIYTKFVAFHWFGSAIVGRVPKLGQ